MRCTEMLIWPKIRFFWWLVRCISTKRKQKNTKEYITIIHVTLSRMTQLSMPEAAAHWCPDSICRNFNVATTVLDTMITYKPIMPRLSNVHRTLSFRIVIMLQLQILMELGPSKVASDPPCPRLSASNSVNWISPCRRAGIEIIPVCECPCAVHATSTMA